MSFPSIDQHPSPTFPEDIWAGDSRTRMSLEEYRQPDAADYAKLYAEVKAMQQFLFPKNVAASISTVQPNLEVVEGSQAFIGGFGLCLNIRISLELLISGTITNISVAIVPNSELFPSRYFNNELLAENLTTTIKLTVFKNGSSSIIDATISYDPILTKFTLSFSISAVDTDVIDVSDNVTVVFPSNQTSL